MTKLNHNGIKWYSSEKIREIKAQYYIIFGERSNGKSYDIDKHLIDEFFKKGHEFAFIKRYEEDIKAKYMSTVFTPLEEYIETEYNHKIRFYRGNWLVYPSESEGKITDCKVCGWAFSIANMNRTKATQYPNVMNLLFEEFMSATADYLPDELNLFINLVSSIVRNRHDARIFMLANAISKYTPYSGALGVKLHRLKHGSIITKTFENEKGQKTTFAIERTDNVDVFDNVKNKDKVVFNIFGNSGVGKMINTGEFETHSYKRIVDNVTFSELAKKGNKVFLKKEEIPFGLQYEDYFYKIYLKYEGKYILGFREIDRVNVNKIKYLINGNDYIKGIININNLACYDDIRVNDIINIIFLCIKQKDFVTLTDDDGENVVNGFRLSGVNISY